MGTTDTLVRLAPIARRSHGVITTRTAAEVGVDRHAIARLRQQELARRLYRGVYALTTAAPTWEQQALAAQLAAGPRAALSHLAAARIHRLDRLPAGAPSIHLTVPTGRLPRGGPPTRQCDLFDPVRHATRIGPFVVTSVPWTLVALGRDVGVRKLQRIYDAAIAAGRVAVHDLDDLLLSWWHHPGVVAARTALAGVLPDFAGTRSDAERRLLRILDVAGLPLPRADVRVGVDGRRYYLDFAYVDRRVWIEVDVHPVHGRPIGQGEDGARQNEIVALGWTPLRFTAGQLAARPDLVVRQVRRALARTPRVPPPRRPPAPPIPG